MVRKSVLVEHHKVVYFWSPRNERAQKKNPVFVHTQKKLNIFLVYLC